MIFFLKLHSYLKKLILIFVNHCQLLVVCISSLFNFVGWIYVIFIIWNVLISFRFRVLM